MLTEHLAMSAHKTAVSKQTGQSSPADLCFNAGLCNALPPADKYIVYRFTPSVTFNC